MKVKKEDRISIICKTEYDMRGGPGETIEFSGYVKEAKDGTIEMTLDGAMVIDRPDGKIPPSPTKKELNAIRKKLKNKT